MSTALAAAVPPTRPASPPLRFELLCPPAVAQRVELTVGRGADGRLEVRGASAPAGGWSEVEVCAGFEQRTARLDAFGGFTVAMASSSAAHVKVILRGGTLPAMVLTRVPVQG